MNIEIGLFPHKCAVCGKRFEAHVEHVYKTGWKGHKVTWFCSYRCMREFQKRRERTAGQMNSLTIIGRLTADPELRATQDGKEVCTFTVAVNRRKGDQADFFRCSAWNQLGQNCKKYLAKGKQVAVRGAVSVRTYTSKDGETRASLEVMADDVEFLTPKGDGYTKVTEPDDPFGGM